MVAAAAAWRVPVWVALLLALRRAKDWQRLAEDAAAQSGRAGQGADLVAQAERAWRRR